MTDQPDAPPAPEGPATPEAAPTPAKGVAGKVIMVTVGVLVVAAVAVAAVFVGRNVLSSADPTRDAKSGDCLGNLPQAVAGEETSVKDVKVVACGAADAKYTVIGRVDDVTAAQASVDEVCRSFADTTMRFYAIPSGGKGYVLCLRPA